MKRLARCGTLALSAFVGTVIFGFAGPAAAGSFVRVPAIACQETEAGLAINHTAYLSEWDPGVSGYGLDWGSADPHGVTVACPFLDTPPYSHGQTSYVNVESYVESGGITIAETCVTYFGNGGGACSPQTNSTGTGYQQLHPSVSAWTSYPYDMAWVQVTVAGTNSTTYSNFTGYFAAY